MKSKLVLISCLLFSLSIFAQKKPLGYRKAIKAAQSALTTQDYLTCVDVLVTQVYSKSPKGKKLTTLTDNLNECHAEAVYELSGKISRLDKEIQKEERSFKLVDDAKEKLNCLKQLQQISDLLNRPKIRPSVEAKIEDYTEQISNTENTISRVSIQTFKDKLRECKVEADYLEKQLGKEKISKLGVSKALKEECRGLAIKLRITAALVENSHTASQLTTYYNEAQMMYKRFQKTGTMRIAIIPLEDMTEKKHMGTTRYISSKLSESLDEQGKPEFIDFVDREVLDEIKAEMDRIGMVDKETMTKFYQTYGVNYLVTGAITLISADAIQKTNLREKKYEETIQEGTQMVLNKKGKKEEKPKYVSKEFITNVTSKEGEANITGDFKIVSMADGNVLKIKTIATTTNFSCKWLTFASGSKEAYIEATERRTKLDDILVEECTTPNKESRIKETADKFATELYKNVNEQLKLITQ